MKKIKIYPNSYALVDDNMYESLSSFKWRLDKDGYAIAWSKMVKGKRKLHRMHRLVLDVEDSTIVIDHIDGDRLNNQKSNLRETNISSNSKNRKKSNSKTSSKYKGVYPSTNSSWRARICVDNKDINLGTYKTEKEAGIAYNDGALKYFGEYAQLNDIQ